MRGTPRIKTLRDYLNAKGKFTVSFGDAEMSIDDVMSLVTHYLNNRNSTEDSKGRKIFNVLNERELSEPVLESDVKEFFSGAEPLFPATENPKFTFIDLFAGMGGFRQAMQNMGGKCVFSSEFNPNAKKTYALNYGDVPFGDITLQENKDAIPEHFDVICGGFPCQAFSIAGYRKGFEDTRGTLFFDVADIIRKHRPKAAFLENVKNLETHDGGKTFSVIKGTLEELGYTVYHKVMDAVVYANIPQHRERVIIVAFNNETVANRGRFEFPEPVELTNTIHDCIIPGKKDEKYYYRESSPYYAKLTETMTNPDTLYQWRRVMCRENKSGVCPTLTANMGGGGHNVPLILTEDGIRKLTSEECLKFMGYPENFRFPDSISESAKYMQAGNSVVVPLMTRVAERIVETIFH